MKHHASTQTSSLHKLQQSHFHGAGSSLDVNGGGDPLVAAYGGILASIGRVEADLLAALGLGGGSSDGGGDDGDFVGDGNIDEGAVMAGGVEEDSERAPGADTAGSGGISKKMRKQPAAQQQQDKKKVVYVTNDTYDDHIRYRLGALVTHAVRRATEDTLAHLGDVTRLVPHGREGAAFVRAQQQGQTRDATRAAASSTTPPPPATMLLLDNKQHIPPPPPTSTPRAAAAVAEDSSDAAVGVLPRATAPAPTPLARVLNRMQQNQSRGSAAASTPPPASGRGVDVAGGDGGDGLVSSPSRGTGRNTNVNVMATSSTSTALMNASAWSQAEEAERAQHQRQQQQQQQMMGLRAAEHATRMTKLQQLADGLIHEGRVEEAEPQIPSKAAGGDAPSLLSMSASAGAGGATRRLAHEMMHGSNSGGGAAAGFPSPQRDNQRYVGQTSSRTPQLAAALHHHGGTHMGQPVYTSARARAYAAQLDTLMMGSNK